MAFNLNPDQDWSTWLEQEPEALYRAFVPKQAGSNFLDYFRSRYKDVYGDYMGSLAKTALSGQPPTQSFANYLKQYPFLNEWFSQSARQRGEPTPARAFWNIKF